MKNKETLMRVYVIYFIVLLLGGGIIFQIFYLQFYKGAELVQDAEKQIFVYKNITAPRGNIYASNEQKTSLALSVPRFKVYVDLVTIKDHIFQDSILPAATTPAIPSLKRDQRFFRCFLDVIGIL